MKTIVDSQTGVSLYVGEVLTLTASGAGGPSWAHASSTTANCTLIEGVTPPADWCGGHYTYIGGVWARTALGTAESQSKLAADCAAVWEAIKAHRDRLSEQGGYLVTVSGVSKWFHSDQKSKTQQLGLLISGVNVPPVPWKTMDGTFVTMSQGWAGAIFAAAAAQDIAIFGAAESHRAAMLAAADPLAYDWRAGWPAVYEGV